MARKKSRFISRPASASAWFRPPDCWKSSTRKPSKPAVAQRQPVLGFVHAEAAGAAGARGEEDVAVEDLLLGQPLLFQVLQELHQVPDREVGRVALAVVAVLLAESGRPSRSARARLAAVAQAFERAMDQLLVLPGQAAEEEGRLVPLVSVKCAQSACGNGELVCEQCWLPSPGAHAPERHVAGSSLPATGSEPVHCCWVLVSKCSSSLTFSPAVLLQRPQTEHAHNPGSSKAAPVSSRKNSFPAGTFLSGGCPGATQKEANGTNSWSKGRLGRVSGEAK